MLPNFIFAFFVFILVCVAMLLWRYLFAGLKQERYYIESKEAELRELLDVIRKEADDFYDLADDKASEIREERNKIAAMVAEFVKPQSDLRLRGDGHGRGSSSARNDTARDNRNDDRRDVRDNRNGDRREGTPALSVFQRAIEDAARNQAAVVAPPPEPAPVAVLVAPPEPEPPREPSLKEQINALTEQGKSLADIALELGITLNEVQLASKI